MFNMGLKCFRQERYQCAAYHMSLGVSSEWLSPVFKCSHATRLCVFSPSHGSPCLSGTLTPSRCASVQEDISFLEQQFVSSVQCLRSFQLDNEVHSRRKLGSFYPNLSKCCFGAPALGVPTLRIHCIHRDTYI